MLIVCLREMSTQACIERVHQQTEVVHGGLVRPSLRQIRNHPSEHCSELPHVAVRIGGVTVP